MTSDLDAVEALGLAPPPVDEYPYDLGVYSLPVTTSSPEAQRWFDYGLNWTYGFHHDEAVKCFRYAIACDSECAMAHWGAAYAAGPNYNKPWEMFDVEELRAALVLCHRASERAVELARTPVEAALASALAARFPLARAEKGNEAEFLSWSRAFIDCMKVVYAQFGDSADVAVVYADSMMAIAPWQLWDLQTGESELYSRRLMPGAPREDSQTLLVKEVLDKALAAPGGMTHPGVLHFYIHLMELSPTPEAALVPADALRSLVPDAGHLRHMPGHIDLLIGDYRRCIASNYDAVTADEKYMTLGSATGFYMFYTMHDYTFVIYAAMFNGQSAHALLTCDRMETWLTDDFMRIASPPMIDWMEGFLTFKVHILVRFGMWDDILALPFPEDRAFYSVTTAFIHYGRALSLALTGRLDESAVERDEFRAARKRVQPSRQAFPNVWPDIFDIAEEMLTGEYEYRRGNVSAAFEHLRKCISLNDKLIYAEPWGWMQPPRHAYAALQLEQGNVAEAAQAYAEDLGFADTLPRALRHPNNVWALHGYHECLLKLGREAEAKMIKRELDVALAAADITIESSCFCRKVEPGSSNKAPHLAASAAVAGQPKCCKL